MYNDSRYLELHRRAKKEFPRFSVCLRKKSWLHPIFWVLSKITRKDYSGFTTTIFSTVYAADDWKLRRADDKYKTMRHELKHVRQFHCWPLGRRVWPLNHVIMGLCYLLVLPVLWTFRAKFEREGYKETLLVRYELYGPFSDEDAESAADWLADTFGGSTYAWMWTRKKARAWALETIRKIHAGEITAADGDRVDESPAA